MDKGKKAFEFAIFMLSHCLEHKKQLLLHGTIILFMLYYVLCAPELSC